MGSEMCIRDRFGLIGILVALGLSWAFQYLFVVPSKIWDDNQHRISDLSPENPILPILLKRKESGVFYTDHHFEKNKNHSHHRYYAAKEIAYIKHEFGKSEIIECELTVSVSGASSSIDTHFILGREIKLGENRSQDLQLLISEMVAHNDECHHIGLISIKSDIVDLSSIPFASNLYYEFLFTFKKQGYRPVSQKLYLLENGCLVSDVPQGWGSYEPLRHGQCAENTVYMRVKSSSRRVILEGGESANT